MTAASRSEGDLALEVWFGVLSASRAPAAEGGCTVDDGASARATRRFAAEGGDGHGD